MFWTTVEEAHADLRDLRNVVASNEAIRDLLFPTNVAHEDAALGAALRPIRGTVPTRPVWALHDYCAAVTRLYSILEDFADSILEEYLISLPMIFPNYNELPQQTLTQHRMGVSQILAKLGDRGLFRHLTGLETLRGITDGYSGQKYTLLREAFLTDRQNYRAEQINILFAYLGISNIWGGVEKHSSVTEYMKTRDPNDTPKTLLKKIVDDRNLASHSGITSVLAPDETLSLITFIEAVVTAIAEIARKTCVKLQCTAGIRIEMFEVQHLFSNLIVGVRFLKGSVKVGDSLIALDQGAAFKVTVLSIHHHQEVLESADADSFGELGLGLDVNVGRTARIVAYQPS
jgi:hypothetical protein